MERWWEIEIRGRYRDKPREVRDTVQGFSAEDAAMRAVNAEIGRVDPLDYDYYKQADGRQGVAFVEGAFRTEQATFEEMATEITDPVRLARLDGAPELPLGLDEAHR